MTALSDRFIRFALLFMVAAVCGLTLMVPGTACADDAAVPDDDSATLPGAPPSGEPALTLGIVLSASGGGSLIVSSITGGVLGCTPATCRSLIPAVVGSVAALSVGSVLTVVGAVTEAKRDAWFKAHPEAGVADLQPLLDVDPQGGMVFGLQGRF